MDSFEAKSIFRPLSREYKYSMATWTRQFANMRSITPSGASTVCCRSVLTGNCGNFIVCLFSQTFLYFVTERPTSHFIPCDRNLPRVHIYSIWRLKTLFIFTSAHRLSVREECFLFQNSSFHFRQSQCTNTRSMRLCDCARCTHWWLRGSHGEFLPRRNVQISILGNSHMSFSLSLHFLSSSTSTIRSTCTTTGGFTLQKDIRCRSMTDYECLQSSSVRTRKGLHCLRTTLFTISTRRAWTRRRSRRKKKAARKRKEVEGNEGEV